MPHIVRFLESNGSREHRKIVPERTPMVFGLIGKRSPLKCRYIVGAKYSHSVSCRPYIQGWDLCLYRLVMRGTCDIELLDKTGGSAVLYTVEVPLHCRG
ncbi:hypothetical protein J6590_020234 [Homalodisca vitripennis]|nr:hypothetical protein J6590_020234 [Homalodisca vitripennis]